MCSFDPWCAFVLGIAVPVVPYLVVRICILVRDVRDMIPKG